MVHHGAGFRSRRLEVMIRAVRRLPARFTLDLLLVGADHAYLEALRREAAGDPRVRFLPPVPMRALPRFLHAYDVGLSLLPPISFNNVHALPNKFFEFVQARLAVVIGPSPEMAALTARHDLGVIAGDFTVDGLVAALASLDRARIERYKRAAHAAARELSADAMRARWLALVGGALAAPGAA
jgi:glycosyltransferase involved in cell wall biosynthesis